MPHQIIIPTGYMNSGSSAVTDLISEFDDFDAVNGSYEYIFLHCPNGVFDLEDKLLRGNNAIRSDEAIHAFLQYMERLYKPGYWFTGYDTRLTPDFLTYCREFIEELKPVRMTDMVWYHQDVSEPFAKRFRRRLGRRLVQYDGRRFLGMEFKASHNYSDMISAWPTEEEFYAAARRFLAKLMGDMGIDRHHIVADQLLLPHNLFRLDHYFDENIRVIVVDRDPRDVFLLNKYFLLKNGGVVPLPTDAEEFCRAYAGIRRSERRTDDPRVLRLHFEDLIFRYDETVERVYAFLGVSPGQHAARRKTALVPERSVHNTRLFDKKADYAAEGRLIAERLPEYLYDFPGEAGTWQETMVF